MAESTTIATLRHKRDEIASSIVAYEKRLAQARADLAHINAAITIFSSRTSWHGEHPAPYFLAALVAIGCEVVKLEDI
jgi:hypothetical protein